MSIKMFPRQQTGTEKSIDTTYSIFSFNRIDKDSVPKLEVEEISSFQKALDHANEYFKHQHVSIIEFRTSMRVVFHRNI